MRDDNYTPDELAEAARALTPEELAAVQAARAAVRRQTFADTQPEPNEPLH